MEKKPLSIAFCSQKGGVGKSTMTVFAADWLYYIAGLNILVVDCDFPQHSIDELRNREKKALTENDRYKLMLMRQFDKYEKKAYPILRLKPESAVAEVRQYLKQNERQYDIILFDLPGTINTTGVIFTISQLDYIFIPMRPDRMIMQSTINFARTISSRFVDNPAASMKNLYLFWNMVDRRTKPDLCVPFEQLLSTLNLNYFKTRLPLRTKFVKEFADTKGEISRSTIFVPDKSFFEDTGFDKLMQEIMNIIDPEYNGEKI